MGQSGSLRSMPREEHVHCVPSAFNELTGSPPGQSIQFPARAGNCSSPVKVTFIITVGQGWSLPLVAPSPVAQVPDRISVMVSHFRWK